MKLWEGLLTGDLNKDAEAFNASISYDKRLVFYDIEGSIAHVRMLGECEIISKKDSEKIIDGLKGLKEDLEKGDLLVDESYEDIHTFIEAALIERIGEAGKKMHTARSRNDQIATDLRLYTRDEIKNIGGLLKAYVKALMDLAEANLDTIMPGYTPLQAAQPVSLGHHLMAYAFMGLRDLGRLEDALKRVNMSPLGSCALAGTTYPIDRYMTAGLLGFESLMENSMDGVSDRDFVLETHSVLSQIALHLSRICEELIIWSSQPFSFIRLSDDFVTGSSIMPQKKNPDMAELIRGKAARIIGNMDQAHIMVKGLGLAYSKDLQEDKQGLFDSIDNIKMSLRIMAPMVKSMKVNKKRMVEEAKKGYINATDLADYLVDKGLAFRDAHHISAKAVGVCIEKNIGLEDLNLKDYKKISEAFEEDLYEKIDLKTCLEKRKSKGGPSPSEVKRQIDLVSKKLDEFDF